MPLNPRTLDELKANVFDIFVKANPKSKEIFDKQIHTWAYELAKAYPWYFLREYPINPSEFAFPLNLSTVTRIKHNFIAPGWLVLEPGVYQYQLAAPMEFEQFENAAWWDDVYCDKIWWVKTFNENDGTFSNDLELFTRNQAFSFQTFVGDRKAQYCVLNNTGDGSYLEVYPTPQQRQLVAIEFQNSRPAFYVNADDNKTYNKIMINIPRALELYAMIFLTHYFDEPTLRVAFREELYGSGDITNLRAAIRNKGGLIGDFIRDSEKAATQESNFLPFYPSAKQALGRNGHPRRTRFPNRWGYR